MKTGGENKHIGRLVVNCLLVIVLPLSVLVGIYAAIDPFKVLRDHDVWFETMKPPVNKGLVSLRNYEKYSREVPFDSFILGPSQSINYRVEQWLQHLPEGAVATHFDSSAESLHSLRLKLQYLDSQGADIKNVLIVEPPTIFNHEDHDVPVFINRPEIDPQMSWLRYHWSHIKAFYHRDFIKSYILSRLMQRPVAIAYADAIEVMAMEVQPLVYTPLTNQETAPLYDDSIARFADQYYAKRANVFSRPRVPHQVIDSVTPDKIDDLRAIKAIFDKHNTDYQVIIVPVLNKSYISPASLGALQQTLGRDRVHDFSSTLASRADVDTNFYDGTHHRYPLAAEIMDSVYNRREK